MLTIIADGFLAVLTLIMPKFCFLVNKTLKRPEIGEKTSPHMAITHFKDGKYELKPPTINS